MKNKEPYFPKPQNKEEIKIIYFINYVFINYNEVDKVSCENHTIYKNDGGYLVDLKYFIPSANIRCIEFKNG